jgi:serine protease inhibitor
VGFALLILCSWFAAAPPASAATSASTAQPAPAAPEEFVAAQRANGEFAIDLYRQLSREQPGKNLFFSPFSISTALLMAAEGAVDETFRQMATVLHLPSEEPRSGADRPLAGIHRAQASLASGMVPPDVPASVRDEVERLRAEMEAANSTTRRLEQSGAFSEAFKSRATAQRLADDLNRLLADVDLYELRIANALWAEKTYPFRRSYVDALQPVYGAVLRPVDFKNNFERARLQINDWAEQQTNNRIRDVIPPGALDAYTRLVITNAVYFKGSWLEPFPDRQTRDTPFLGGGTVKLMHDPDCATARYGAFNADGTYFTTPYEIHIEMPPTDPSLYPDERGFTLLSLPYKGRKLSMVWLLPRSATGVPALEELLTHDKLQAWLQRLEGRKVDLSVARVKLETNYRPTDSRIWAWFAPSSIRDATRRERNSTP